MSILDLTPATAVDGRRAWSASGAMALTGRAAGPPLAVAESVGARLVGLADALARTSEKARRRVDVDGPALLGERAVFTGAGRNGSTSVGGSCRLLRTADSWMAVSLARPDDTDLVPAWLGVDPDGDGWPAIEEA
ncbi:MAG: hypothetical protein QOD72_1071, partial [Acidimicrobiaceae bacterium]|nr:hypothetical protein [Acidimicrobiaceae bacterium]